MPRNLVKTRKLVNLESFHKYNTNLKLYLNIDINTNTSKPVYKYHSKELENYICTTEYSLMGKMSLPFIDSDLLYTGTL